MFKKTAIIVGLLFICLSHFALIVGSVSEKALAQAKADIFEEVFDPLEKTGLRQDFPGMDEQKGGTGENIIERAVNAVTEFWRNILASIAVLFIVIAGFRVVTSADEAVINTNRQLLTWSMVGLAIVLMADVMVRDILFGRTFSGENLGGVFEDPESILKAAGPLDEEGGGGFASKEIMGIVAWVQTIISAVAILVIAISAGRLLVNVGNEDNIGQQKSVLLSIGLGLIMLAFNRVAVEVVYKPTIIDEALKSDAPVKIESNALQGIQEIIGLIQYFLQFAAVLALAGLLYGGFLMIYHFGNDERVEQAKRIIRDVIIGLVLIFSAYAVSATLISATS